MKRVEELSVYTDFYRAFLRSKGLVEGDPLPPTWDFFAFIEKAQEYALERGMGFEKASVWPGRKRTDWGLYVLAVEEYAEIKSREIADSC
jgi:hypothetical protein